MAHSGDSWANFGSETGVEWAGLDWIGFTGEETDLDLGDGESGGFGLCLEMRKAGEWHWEDLTDGIPPGERLTVEIWSSKPARVWFNLFLGVKEMMLAEALRICPVVLQKILSVGLVLESHRAPLSGLLFVNLTEMILRLSTGAVISEASSEVEKSFLILAMMTKIVQPLETAATSQEKSWSLRQNYIHRRILWSSRRSTAWKVKPNIQNLLHFQQLQTLRKKTDI